MKLIVLNINNLTDARYFAAWNVDYLALQVDPEAEMYVSPEYFHALHAWIEGPQIILIPPPNQELQSIADLYSKDSAFMLDNGKPNKINQNYFQRISIQTTSIANEVRNGLSGLAQGFVLDFSSAGIRWDDLKQNKLGEFEEWKKLFMEFPVYLQMDFGSKEMEEMIQIGVHGICLSGGEEEKVGVKSFDDLDEIFEKLEEIQQN